MATALQIRDMPDDVMAKLRARARRRSLSLSAYAREILEREARRATMEETLSGPRLRTGRPLSAGEIKRFVEAGRR